jgi:tetratricopeptide (TPR) repeat protein
MWRRWPYVDVQIADLLQGRILGSISMGRFSVLGLVFVAACAVGSASPSHADPSRPVIEDVRQPPSVVTPEGEYNRGIRARIASDLAAAEAAFRGALALRPSFPEAWSELGYALRHLGRYGESLRAYDEALRLRQRFPEALEYLGEAYVEMGRLDDARRVLDRLRPLDRSRAAELAEEIAKVK